MSGYTPPAAAAYLAAIISSSDDAIIAHDLDARITLWNAAAERLLGYTAADAIGKPTHLLFPADKQADEVETLKRVWSGENVSHFETTLMAADGRCIDVSLTISAIRDDTGQVIGASTIARDLTERKLNGVAALRLGAIVESSDDAIVSKDLNGIVTSWNLAAERMFGYTPEEMIGQSITRIIPKERLDEETFVLGQVRKGLRVEHFETVRQDKFGRPLQISLTVSPILAPDGRVIGASKIARDITKHKELLEAQRAAQAREEAARRQVLEIENRRIQEASRLKGEFVANMSHELRTPLNSIIGFAELMVDERLGPMPPKYAEFSSLILKSAGHLLQLINDILDLAKVESGKIDLKPERLLLSSIVEDVTSIASGLARKRNIRIDTIVDPKVDAVHLDPTRFKQVLYNYLSNAIKFSHDDGCVEVRIRPDGADQFCLEVQDWGIGIKDEDMSRLFIEFQQLDASTAKHYQGTGLGLALAKRIVEAQGGSVGVHTDFGAGCTFYAKMPKHVSARSADVTSSDATVQGRPEGRLYEDAAEVRSADLEVGPDR
jgi:PAS domain S-box-containing protein